MCEYCGFVILQDGKVPLATVDNRVSSQKTIPPTVRERSLGLGLGSGICATIRRSRCDAFDSPNMVIWKILYCGS